MSQTDAASRKTGLRWQLRQATQDLHAEADSLGSRFDLGQPAGYAAFLQAHALALPGLEAACGAALPRDQWPDWPARCRSTALLADLAQLGVAPPAPLPVPRAADAAEALGMAYVLEGSRLGNGMLLRQLRAAAPALPSAYLAHDPQAVSPDGWPGAAPGWPGFLARLEAALPEPAHWPAAEHGARRAFLTFLAALRRGTSPDAAPHV